MPTRSAKADWQGDFKRGGGSVSTETGVLDAQYNFSGRFESGDRHQPGGAAGRRPRLVLHDGPVRRPDPGGQPAGVTRHRGQGHRRPGRRRLRDHQDRAVRHRQGARAWTPTASPPRPRAPRRAARCRRRSRASRRSLWRRTSSLGGRPPAGAGRRPTACSRAGTLVAIPRDTKRSSTRTSTSCAVRLAGATRPASGTKQSRACGHSPPHPPHDRRDHTRHRAVPVLRTRRRARARTPSENRDDEVRRDRSRSAIQPSRAPTAACSGPRHRQIARCDLQDPRRVEQRHGHLGSRRRPRR